MQMHMLVECRAKMTATPERARSIAFSQPYLTTGLTLLVGKNSPIKSADDLDRPGIRVAVKIGTTAHKFAARDLKQAQVFVLNRESAAVLEVIQGKVDAFIYDSLSIYRHHRRHPDTTRALLKPFREETWAIGLRKADEKLRMQINSFLKQFKEEGGFEKLGDEFLPEEKAYSRKTASLSTFSFTESADILSAFPWGSWPRSRCSWPAAGAHWRHPDAGWQWARLASRKARASCRCRSARMLCRF